MPSTLKPSRRWIVRLGSSGDAKTRDEAIKLWKDNPKAKQGLDETRLLHAEAAYDKGDFDLGLSLLDEGKAEHQPLIQKLVDGRDGRASRDKWLKRLKVADPQGRQIPLEQLVDIEIGPGVAQISRQEVFRCRTSQN